MFPQTLAVEHRVSLHQETGPAVGQLEVESVAADLPVLTAGLDEEPVLQFSSKNNFVDMERKTGLPARDHFMAEKDVILILLEEKVEYLKL